MRRRRRPRFLTDSEIRIVYANADRKMGRSRIPSGVQVDAMLRRAKPVHPRKRKSEIVAGLEGIL